MHSYLFVADSLAALHEMIRGADASLAWIDDAGARLYKRSRVSDPFREMADGDTVEDADTGEAITLRVPTGRWLINVDLPAPSAALDALSIVPAPATPELVAC